ncbi:hypothetical protein FRC09_010503 [Ceratobasidium sp. 395]|nr:hypothetical protein FRC09_010503 [Ceratobasidium sp. 395]
MSSSTTLLHGKKILIIGGSSGIGKAVAAAALAHGAFVVISSSSQKRVEAAVAELKTVGANVSGAAFDVKDAQALKNFLTAQGSFDHLVDTAGEAHPGTFPQEDITEQTRGNFE